MPEQIPDWLKAMLFGPGSAAGAARRLMPRGPGVEYPPGLEPGQPQQPGTPRPGPGMGPPIVGAEAPPPQLVPGFGPGGLPQPPAPNPPLVPMPRTPEDEFRARGLTPPPGWLEPEPPQMPGFPQMPKSVGEEGGIGKSPVEEGGSGIRPSDMAMGLAPVVGRPAPPPPITPREPEDPFGTNPFGPRPGVGPQFMPPGDPRWNDPNYTPNRPPPSDEERAISALQAQIEASKRMQRGR